MHLTRIGQQGELRRQLFALWGKILAEGVPKKRQSIWLQYMEHLSSAGPEKPTTPTKEI